MGSKFHEKAISRISPEERALMIKSLDIIVQIHDILERKEISQKVLADNLKISQAAVSKMLSPGTNLSLSTIVRFELFLGETIITTPKKVAEWEKLAVKDWALPLEEKIEKEKMIWMDTDYSRAETRLFVRA